MAKNSLLQRVIHRLATSDAELEQIIGEGGRRGQIYSDLKALRDRYAELVRTRFPRIKRRVSGFNLDELLPENGFNVARALVARDVPANSIVKGSLSATSPGARDKFGVPSP